MTVSTTENRKSYAGNGATTAFSFPYYFSANADLVVVLTTTVGALVTKTLTTDYTVTGAGVANGGTVTMLTAPATGESLVIYRDPQLTQEADFEDGDALPAATIEGAFDKLTTMVQRASDLVKRSLRLADGDAATTLGALPIASARANLLLSFDADGNPEAVAPTAGTATALSLLLASVSGAGLVGFGSTTVADQLSTFGAQIAKSTQQFRLTLTSGTPVTSADVTSASTIYLTPYTGNVIGLYDPDLGWGACEIAQISKTLSGLTIARPYDVFAYTADFVTVALEFTAWASDTARATDLAVQDGVLVKSGSASYRYLGTFYTTSASTTEDSAYRRYLWNYYNRVDRSLAKVIATASWSYNTDTFSVFNSDTLNSVGIINGVAEESLTLSVVAAGTLVNANSAMRAGIGLTSSAATNIASAWGVYATGGAGSVGAAVASYAGVPAIGQARYAPTFRGNGLGAKTWYGTDAANGNSSITGRWRA